MQSVKEVCVVRSLVMSEEKIDIPLSSKEARTKLYYLYYQQFHSTHRAWRAPNSRSPILYNVTYIYSVYRMDWLEPVCLLAIPSIVFMLIFGMLFAGIWYFGKDKLGDMLIPLLVLSGIFILGGLIAYIMSIVKFISLIRARSRFIKDFLADERTSECCRRKKAAKWLWDFVAEHSMRDEAILKYTYVPEWYDEYGYLLKWI